MTHKHLLHTADYGEVSTLDACFRYSALAIIPIGEMHGGVKWKRQLISAPSKQ